MKPEDRRRLKQNIEMIVEHKIPEENEMILEKVPEYADAAWWRMRFEQMYIIWQNEHAEVLTLREKLKFAEERVRYLRATIMNEIEDEPTVDTESMMFHDKNGGGV